MTKLLVALGAAFALAACAGTPKPQTVLIPCRAPVVPTPAFPADHLVSNDIFEQAKGLLADRLVRKGYEAQLEASVAACE